MHDKSQSASSSLYKVGGYIALAVLTSAIYLRAPELGFFAEWDDRLYMVARPEVRDWFAATWSQRLLTPELGYPVPIPTFMYYVLRQLPGDWVVPVAHLVNAFVHLGNVLLVYVNGLRRTEARRVAFVATAIWAAHPLLVESVAWLTNLKTLLAAGFLFCAWWMWDRYCNEPTSLGAAATGLFVVLALGCRPEAAMAIPLFLGELWFRRPEEFQEFRTLLFFGVLSAIGVIYAVVAVVGQFTVFARSNVSPPPDLGLFERLTRIGAAFGLQVRHVVYPLELHPSYPAEALSLVREAGAGAAIFVVLATVCWMTIRRCPRSAWGWGIWWGFYLPASGIVFLPRFTADTYMYIPLFGFVFALTVVTDTVLRSQRRRVRLVAGGAAAVFVCVLGFRAHTQTLRWRNKMTLWGPVVEERPEAVRGNWMVGAAYVEAGEYQKALEHYERVYRQVANRGRIPLRMAEAYEETGDVERAAGVAAKILLYEGKTPPETDRYLVDLVVSEGLNVEADIGRALEVAADSLLEGPEGELDPEFCAEAAEWFAEAGRSQYAAAFARRAIRRRSETCRAWEVLERTRDGEISGLPKRPEACR